MAILILCFLVYQVESKNSLFCPSQQKWFAGPYKTIPEERPGGKYMLEQLHYEWSQSFHIEFEFNWTEPSPHWQAVFHVTGPTQNNDHRVPTIYQYPGTTLSFGIYLLARHGWMIHGLKFGNEEWKGKWLKFEMDVIEYEESVDGVQYVDNVYNNHLYDVAADSGWVWIGDPWHPYTNPDFQMRRIYYGPRSEAIKFGLVN